MGPLPTARFPRYFLEYSIQKVSIKSFCFYCTSYKTNCTVFKTDKTFTRTQRPKLSFFSSPHLHSTGGCNTYWWNQLTKNVLILGASELYWAFCTVQFRDCW